MPSSTTGKAMESVPWDSADLAITDMSFGTWISGSIQEFWHSNQILQKHSFNIDLKD